MPGTEHRIVRYRGPAPFASALAQMLEEEGVQVSYDPPREYKSAGDVLVGVVVNIACAGAYEAIKAGVVRFRASRLGKSAEVEVERDDEGGADSES